MSTHKQMTQATIDHPTRSLMTPAVPRPSRIATTARTARLADAWGIATCAGMLRALLRGAGGPEDALIPGSGLDMMLAEIADLDASESGEERVSAFWDGR
jgi:hypothetical protein